RQLVAPTNSTLRGEPQYRFRHLLMAEAAYGILPKSLRAELHERFAGWLEHAAGDQLGEYGVIVGVHLERAYRERMALGPVDDRARALAAAAAARLAAAGRSALVRHDRH